MSLRAFHIFFIAASIVLCGFVARWGLLDYRQHGTVGGLGLAVVGAILALALIAYGLKVYRKLQELGR